MKSARPRGSRGLDVSRLVRAALAEIERTGLHAFSLRSVARTCACDPAALIYRFGSREGLERAVADVLHSGIGRLDPSLPWRERLLGMAREYRALAHRYPRTFPLLMRYWTTGPKDLALADDCYAALCEAGVPDRFIPATEHGLYAAILGLCAGEVGGLVGSPSDGMVAEIRAQDHLAITRRLLPAIRKVDADLVFERTIAILLDGIAAAHRTAPAALRLRRPRDTPQIRTPVKSRSRNR